MHSKNKKSTWETLSKRFEKHALKHENILSESGHWGQGSSVDGAATFRGGPYGIGGENQLAGGLSEPVKKLKKDQDEEAIYNIANQQKINRGYPAPESVSGFPGGESGSGIRSGEKDPNNISGFAVTTDEFEAMTYREPEKQYFGFDSIDVDDEDNEGGLREQGGQGPQRGGASDSNYRDLPGWPRLNSIEKPGNFVPEVEGDEDGDGEEDVYLTDTEYVNDVLRLNGIDIKPGHMKKLFGTGNLEEASVKERNIIVKKVMTLSKSEVDKQLRHYEWMSNDSLVKQRKKRYGGDAQRLKKQQLAFDFIESNQYSLGKLFLETYTSPSYGPEPNKGIERYKQGNREETPQGDDWLISPEDFSGGHVDMPAAERSPGAQAGGQIGTPKDFVPEDWEQRHFKTKQEPVEPGELRSVIESIVEEVFEEAYTGIDDETGKGKPVGGSAAFQTSRKKVFAYDKTKNEHKKIVSRRIKS